MNDITEQEIKHVEQLVSEGVAIPAVIVAAILARLRQAMGLRKGAVEVR